MSRRVETLEGRGTEILPPGNLPAVDGYQRVFAVCIVSPGIRRCAP